MKAIFAWCRRQLAFSTSSAAWTERLAALGLLVAGAGGWWLSRGLPLDGRLMLLDLWLVVACLLMRAEIIHLLGPVFFFEILRGSRRWVHLSRALYAALLLGSIVYVYLIEFERFAPDELNQQARMANSFFLVFSGKPRDEAIVEANHTRLRPILMTTVMLIAAMIPIAMGQGPGSGARASMAKVIIGGQMLSLLLALLVTPVIYSLIDSVGNLLGRLWPRPAKVVSHATPLNSVPMELVEQ